MESLVRHWRQFFCFFRVLLCRWKKNFKVICFITFFFFKFLLQNQFIMFRRGRVSFNWNIYFSFFCKKTCVENPNSISEFFQKFISSVFFIVMTISWNLEQSMLKIAFCVIASKKFEYRFKNKFWWVIWTVQQNEKNSHLHMWNWN